MKALWSSILGSTGIGTAKGTGLDCILNTTRQILITQNVTMDIKMNEATLINSTFIVGNLSSFSIAIQLSKKFLIDSVRNPRISLVVI